MKSYYKLLFLSVMLVVPILGWGQIQISESFENGLPTSYTATTSYTLGSGTWTGQANGVIRGTSGLHGGSYSCQLKNQTGAQITSPNIASGGVSTVTFYGSSSTASGSVQVNYSIDGGATWTAATGSPFSLTTGTTVLKTATINSSSPNIIVQFYRTASTVYIDDITITANGSSNSASSDIIRNSTFSEPVNIAYTSYQETNLTSSSLEVARFDIRDGGGSVDGDALGTTLSAITFSLSNWANVRRVALYDGTTEIAELAVSSGSLVLVRLQV
ncbi:MAG: hypothetical protein WCL06_04235 [Bacteroidota bacterium]